jgi:monoamine oxidase
MAQDAVDVAIVGGWFRRPDRRTRVREGGQACGSAIRGPVGRIHLAGTEIAIVNCGYIDGAVCSGERVAAEVLAAH